jgi:hypothetical protein
VVPRGAKWLLCSELVSDRKNRVTFHYDGGRIVLRKHCNHDILRRP